jgi:hypothetical protein
VYFALARFYAWVGAAPEEIEERLRIIDQRNPIGDGDYIERTAGNARKYAGFAGCNGRGFEGFCDPADCYLGRGAAERGQKEKGGDTR